MVLTHVNFLFQIRVYRFLLRLHLWRSMRLLCMLWQLMTLHTPLWKWRAPSPAQWNINLQGLTSQMGSLATTSTVTIRLVGYPLACLGSVRCHRSLRSMARCCQEIKHHWSCLALHPMSTSLWKWQLRAWVVHCRPQLIASRQRCLYRNSLVKLVEMISMNQESFFVRTIQAHQCPLRQLLWWAQGLTMSTQRRFPTPACITRAAWFRLLGWTHPLYCPDHLPEKLLSLCHISGVALLKLERFST